MGSLAIIFISRSKLLVFGDGVLRRWGSNEFAHIEECFIIALGEILCGINSIFFDI